MTKLEIIELIGHIDKAILHILKGGQSYTIGSASGSSRAFTGADLDTLRSMKNEYESKLAGLNKKKAVKIQIGW